MTNFTVRKSKPGAGNKHYIKESPKKLLTVFMIPFGCLLKREVIKRGKC